MGIKIREISNNQRRKKVNERKSQDKLSYTQTHTFQNRVNQISMPEEKEELDSNQSSSSSSLFSYYCNQTPNQNSSSQQDKNIPIQVASHRIVGQIKYREDNRKIDSNTNEKQQQKYGEDSRESNKSIEQQVLEYYQSKIEKLDVRQTLKSYLRRTLDTIIISNDSDKIFLLEIRKQLKQSQRIASKEEYSDFLQLVDNLYLLAVDKHISQINGSITNSTSSSFFSFHESTSAAQTGIIGENNATSPSLANSLLRIQATNSTEIVRLLQRNALQRLAQAYRRVTSNSINRIGSIASGYTSILRDNYLTQPSRVADDNEERPSTYIAQTLQSDSIEMNERRTVNEENHQPLLSTMVNHINIQGEINSQNNNHNPTVDDNEEDEDLFSFIRVPIDSMDIQRRQQLMSSSTTNSGLLSITRGRYNGVRSNSNQVSANVGDSSLQTASETASNISN